MTIYLVPFLLDFQLFFVMLRLADASGREMQLSNSQATALLLSFSIGYLVTSPLAGRVLQARSPKPLLLFSIVAIGLCSVPLLFTTTFWPTFLLIGVLGIAAALAFNAFQALVRNQSPDGALAVTVARYTVAWSCGVGSGYIVGGVMRSLVEPFGLAAFCVVACSLLLVLVWYFQTAPTSSTRCETTAESTTAESTTPEPITVESTPIDARYIAIAWSLIFAANFVQRPLTTFIPKFSAQDGNPSWTAGVLLAAALFTQAAVGFAMQRRTRWLYRRKPLVILQIGLVIVLGLLWMTQAFFASLILMIFLGALHGFTYFASVYIASNSVRSARNIGLNEMMVGVGNVAGMILCDRAIAWLHFERAFYPTTMLFCVLLLAAQMWWLRDSSKPRISPPKISKPETSPNTAAITHNKVTM